MASHSTAMLKRDAQTTHFSTLRVHFRPARSIFSEALNFCCSAIVLEVAADSSTRA